MTRALSIAELAAMAAASEDQTETKAGGFEREIPPAGKTVGRLIEYIEIGKRPGGQYLGKAKPDAEKVRITFELLTPVHITEYEDNGVKKERANRITITIKKSLSDKAKFKKLFNQMTYGRDGIKHMALMLGEAFILGIYHNVEEKDGKKVTYVNLNANGSQEYDVSAPVIVDPLTNTSTKVNIREAISPIRLFLWANPTKETWDSLFIDGTHTVKDDKGVETEVSNNWMQEMLLDALDFKGSALEALLGGVADLPVEEPAQEQPAQAAESAPAAQASAAPAGGSNEALAALGLM